MVNVMEQISRSIDIGVLRKADTFARRRGMKRQDLILAALNWLDGLAKEQWKHCFPDGWPGNRVLKETSFRYPKGMETIINQGHLLLCSNTFNAGFEQSLLQHHLQRLNIF